MATVDYFYTQRIVFWSARTNSPSLIPHLIHSLQPLHSCSLPPSSYQHLLRFHQSEFMQYWISFINDNSSSHEFTRHLVPYSVSLPYFIMSSTVYCSQHCDFPPTYFSSSHAICLYIYVSCSFSTVKGYLCLPPSYSCSFLYVYIHTSVSFQISNSSAAVAPFCSLNSDFFSESNEKS